MRGIVTAAFLWVICLLPASARSQQTVHRNPAHDMVQTLHHMGQLLNTVDNKQEATAATAELRQLYTRFFRLQQAAEQQQGMPPAALERHLAQMDAAMNYFRLACARLVREKFYGSTPLSKAVKEIAGQF